MFLGCTSLPELDISEGVTEMEGLVFSSGLHKVTLPKSLKMISNLTFANTDNLQEITYRGTMEEWSKVQKTHYQCSWWNFSAIDCSDGKVNINS